MKSRKLIKNYIYNTLYQILVLIAPLITTPYISRILGVTNIGIYQYSQSIASYFVLMGAVGTTLYGQREIAYLQNDPEERTRAFWEIELFRIVATALCLAIYLVVFCAHGAYYQIYVILSLEILATAVDISWLFMGMEDFKLTVIRNTIIKITGIICVFLFVKKASDLRIYTLCVTLPLFLGNISLWFSMNKYLVNTGMSIAEVIHGIKRRLRPIFVLFLPQIAMDVYLVLDKTMIGLLGSGIDQVGYYSQGQKIVKVILTIVTSLGTVMLPAMSAYFARGDLEGIKSSVKTAFRFIYMISFALMFGLCAICHRFVPFFFGDGYEPVISLIIIISPILVIIGTSNVIGRQYLLPTNQQRAFTYSIIGGAVVNFILNYILIQKWDAKGASIATVFAELTVMILQCWFVRGQLPILQSLCSGLRYALFGTVMYIICRSIGILLPQNQIWVMIVIVFTGVVVYGTELILTKDPMIKTGLKLLKGMKV